MMITKPLNLRTIVSVMVSLGLWLTVMTGPAFSQEGAQNLLANGDFEQGFQDKFGVGYGWGGFSNGNATVGWSADTWEQVVVKGKYAQLIEIKDATERDRYAGIYQTIPVVPGQQYKLTLKGLIRSEEGDIKISNYGYRLQVGVDYEGGLAWELAPEQNWQEVPWDEQPLSGTNGTFRFDTFETTLTAKSDKLTLFIRAWKKWLDKGSGLYDLDEISLTGPAPENFQAVPGQAAAVGSSTEPVRIELVEPDLSLQDSEHGEDLAPVEQPTVAAPTALPTTAPASITPAPSTDASPQLPVSGRGDETSTNFIVILGVVVLLGLLISAAATMLRRQTPAE
ncbi:MAG: hypothetical protein U0401_00885 [Anaerolineae bacterium]